jgi:hypothetical protein
VNLYTVILFIGITAIGIMIVIFGADNGIFVNKAYREMPKMVGMMGS